MNKNNGTKPNAEKAQNDEYVEVIFDDEEENVNNEPKKETTG